MRWLRLAHFLFFIFSDIKSRNPFTKTEKDVIINMLNKLNIGGTIGVFSSIRGILFLLRLHIEFDKNANSTYVSVMIHLPYKVC